MTLYACPECGNQISDKAMMCPKCGYSAMGQRFFCGEYKSRTQLFGLPLVHIVYGPAMNPATGKLRVAKGIIAIGGLAVGVLALGGAAFGIIAFGGLAVGLLAALGGAAIGTGISIGPLADVQSDIMLSAGRPLGFMLSAAIRLLNNCRNGSDISGIPGKVISRNMKKPRLSCDKRGF
jgi:hypothetical protein